MLMLKMVVRWGTGLRRTRPGFFCRFQFLDIFGRFLVEVLQAALAAEFDFPALIRKDVRASHFAQLFTRDDAGHERIRFRFFRFPFAEGERDQRGECHGTAGTENDFADWIDIIHSRSYRAVFFSWQPLGLPFITAYTALSRIPPGFSLHF